MLDRLHTLKIELLVVLAGIAFGILYFFIPLKYLILLFCGVVGTIAVILKVEIGIFAVVFCLPFMPTMASIALVILTIISFIIKVISQNIKIKYSPLCIWIFTFVGLLILYSLTSVTPKSSIKVALVLISYIAFVFVIINAIRDKKMLFYLMLTLVFSGTLESLYGIYQYRIGLPTIDENWTDPTLFPDIATRVYGTLDNPNILAQYLEFVIPTTFALFWIAKKYWQKALYLIPLGIMTLCLVFTSSRGGWIAVALAIIVFGILKDRRVLAFGGLLAIIAINFVPNSIIERLASVGNLADTSNAYRTFIWKSSLGIIRDFWYSGVGLGVDAFSKIYNSLYMREGVYAFHTHNLYLETFVEMGIMGLFVFLTIVFLYYRHGIAAFIKSSDNFLKAMLAAMIGGMTAFLFHGISENSFYNFKIVLMFWFTIGLVMAIREMNTNEVMQK